MRPTGSAKSRDDDPETTDMPPPISWIHLEIPVIKAMNRIGN